MNQGLFEKPHKLADEVSSFSCSVKGDCNMKSLIDENAQGKLNEKTVFERFIVMEETKGLGALEIKKGNFQELNYVVNLESYFGKQICYWNHVLTWAA